MLRDSGQSRRQVEFIVNHHRRSKASSLIGKDHVFNVRQIIKETYQPSLGESTMTTIRPKLLCVIALLACASIGFAQITVRLPDGRLELAATDASDADANSRAVQVGERFVFHSRIGEQSVFA